MKILFLNQFFWPDSSATSQLLTDLARGLADRGHEVSVICADTGYAPAASDTAPDVRIERVKALRFVRGRAGRMLSYLSFYCMALVKAFLIPKPDMVVSLTTPPLVSLIGSSLKVIRGSRHMIWEMDVYPDVAVDLNYLKANGLSHRITGLLADLSRRHADGILALGECMKERLAGRGIARSQIVVAENWADGTAIRPLPRGGDGKQLVLLYSGNLGLAHDLDTLLGAISAVQHDERFRFIFAGGGGRREEVAAFISAHQLRSVELRPYAPREQLAESLSLGDIGLVTQQDVCCGSVVPSKVYGILASGRPILFIGPRNSTPALTIERFGCGWQIDCGDVEALTALLRHLAEHPDEVRDRGQRARRALLENYDLSIGVNRIVLILESFLRRQAHAEQVQSSILGSSTPNQSTSTRIIERL